ncbi:HicB-like protein involved in pilus formation [Tepidimonas ignava]|jgi:hypothetical protein|uniref:HicB-like protein involved in pilus formation n=1 Tax=Tepidimonas ignava TaxID=114249 RepID=A0A4R3LEJ2_9BURK|nr:toxin-antitoxin system HicB family antitoxin [Tepidimonas ignava]TCS98332.1 HicB-like protein involved in pilus formation [Tepidimonas ignava]TSE21841.1 hypothetical protein Tigna_01568 [Tepidimonas ignava]
MGAVTVRLPSAVHAKVSELASREGISIDQFVASAVAEKMACVLTLDFLRHEAAQGQRAAFDRYLDAVPDEPPAGPDRLPGS